MANGKNAKNWFDVDRKGLAALMAARPKVWILHELIQNALDCKDTTKVEIDMVPVERRSLVNLTVVDDEPEGFRDLAHAYTMFAPSEKKTDPGRRGRFNIGEKLVLSLCDFARITSTKGTVVFGPEGRTVSKRRRRAGTAFEASLRMTREECQTALHDVFQVLPPSRVSITINGKPIPNHPLFHSFGGILPTLKSDGAGVLRTVNRETAVDLYIPNLGETPMLYEMGIPVVELKSGEPWHINVHQKIPVTLDRDNVSPVYLAKLHVLMLNKICNYLLPEDSKAAWVSEAMGSKQVEPEAVRNIVTKRFGGKAVIADPSDREGERMAVSQGYTVVAGGTFPAEVWSNIKAVGALLPAGQVTPSPKPFSPDGKPLKLIDHDDWTPSMWAFAAWFATFASKIAGLSVDVEFTRDRTWKFNAAHSHSRFNAEHLHSDGEFARECGVTFNVGLLGEEWLNATNWKAHVRLSIHELAHQWGHHLEDGYHDALCRLASEAVALSLTRPDFFDHGKVS